LTVGQTPSFLPREHRLRRDGLNVGALLCSESDGHVVVNGREFLRPRREIYGLPA